MKRQRDNGFSEWGGYMEAKMSKLEDQFCTEAENFGLKEDNLFKGISIFVNGYTVPPAYELRNLMMKHGGTFHHYYRSDKTTYIIASNLPDSKLKQVNKMTVIKPEWIVDCIKSGSLLNHKDYLLHTNHSKTQPLLRFDATKKNEVRSAAKTATDDAFLSEFYNNSRLHLISTMGSTFKQYVNDLRKTTKDFPGRDALVNKFKNINEVEDQFKVSDCGKIIMHIDMDCFFVSVSIKHRPDLIGQPVAVTHSKGGKPLPRAGVNLQAEYEAYHGKKSSDPNHWSNKEQSYSMSEIASCSYEARKLGVKNGMFMGQALNLCPNLITLPYDFEGYKEVAKILYDTVSRYTLNIEAVSCDEMFVDCSDLLAAASITPLDFASIIRNEIKEKTQCPCSTGFGANKLQARLATRKAKPDGQFFLEVDMVLDFMSSIPVSDLPGVGRSTTYKLKSMGVSTCLELQGIPLATLKQEFGAKAGETLFNYAFGRDTKSLTLEKVRKSVSAEVNYGIRFQTDSERDKFLRQLSEEVSNRLNEVSMKGKSITLKIMVKSKDAPEETAKFLGHGVCDYFTKTNSLKSHTDDPARIFKEVHLMMGQFNVPSKDLRGIGLQISKLISFQCAENNLNKFFKSKNTKSELNDIKNNEETNSEQIQLSISVPSSYKNVDNLNENTSNVDDGDMSAGASKDKVDIIASAVGTNKIVKDIEKDIGGNVSSKSVELIPNKNSDQCLINSIQPDLHNISLSQIDPSFIEALPDDLKTEILGAIKKKPIPQNLNTESTKSASQSNNSDIIINTNKVPLPLPKESSNDNNLCDKVPPVEMRSLIREWIESCDSPQPCDITMFSDYLTSLVTTHQIDHLHTLLKTFLRKLHNSKKSSEWMSSFETIVEEVQCKMLSVYGAKLIQIE